MTFIIIAEQPHGKLYIQRQPDGELFWSPRIDHATQMTEATANSVASKINEYAHFTEPCVVEEAKTLETSKRVVTIVNQKPYKSGTGLAKRYEEFVAFVEKNPDATLDQILSGSSYTRADFKYGLEKGYYDVK